MQLGVAKEATCNIKKLLLIKAEMQAEQGGVTGGTPCRPFVSSIKFN